MVKVGPMVWCPTHTTAFCWWESKAKMNMKRGYETGWVCWSPNSWRLGSDFDFPDCKHFLGGFLRFHLFKFSGVYPLRYSSRWNSSFTTGIVDEDKLLVDMENGTPFFPWGFIYFNCRALEHLKIIPSQPFSRRYQLPYKLKLQKRSVERREEKGSIEMKQWKNSLNRVIQVETLLSPIVGGHLSFWKGYLTIAKRSQRNARKRDSCGRAICCGDNVPLCWYFRKSRDPATVEVDSLSLISL